VEADHLLSATVTVYNYCSGPKRANMSKTDNQIRLYAFIHFMFLFKFTFSNVRKIALSRIGCFAFSSEIVSENPGSLSRPVRVALFQKCTNALFRVLCGHILDHDTGCIGIGVFQRHLCLCVESLLADFQSQR
jgi:hypothetical protein